MAKKNNLKQAAPTEKSTFISSGLVRLRKRHGLSQRAAAKLCDVKASTWSRWETGDRDPSASMVEKIAKVFHSTPSLVFKSQT